MLNKTRSKLFSQRVIEFGLVQLLQTKVWRMRCDIHIHRCNLCATSAISFLYKIRYKYTHSRVLFVQIYTQLYAKRKSFLEGCARKPPEHVLLLHYHVSSLLLLCDIISLFWHNKIILILIIIYYYYVIMNK